MGLDADVNCRCVPDGLSSPPPVPEFVETSADDHAALFRAMRVKQRSAGDGHNELIDLDTGASWSSPVALRNYARIERSVLDASHHRRVFDALLAVFKVSASFGQTVVWC